VKRIVIIWMVLAAVAFGQDKALKTDQNSEPDKSGKIAPDFRLQDIDRNNVELNKILGKGPVLISFWATWCKPCVEEMAEYTLIYNEYKAKGLEMLAISVDDEKSVAKVKPYVKSKNYPFTVLLDTNSEVARKYYVRSVPMTFLLNDEGRIIYQSLGFKKGDEIKLKKIIKELLEFSYCNYFQC
jgi:cytochrome c biogenesis protein CcmG, thiol:disulfide interchange protein DsbE